MSFVSVIVPCFNHAIYLSDALQSVFDQTHSQWECIIVNDGSIDNTEEIALAWLKKDQRFRYFKKENGGLSSARNAGIDLARGEFIQFLDADDAIHPDKLRIQLKSIDSNSSNTLCYTDYSASTEKSLFEQVQKYRSPKFKSSNYLIEFINRWESSLSIPCHCFLISSITIWDNAIRFDESLRNHEDWDFWMNILRYKPRVYFVEKELAIYRIGSSSMSRNYKQMKRGFLQAIKKQQRNYSFYSQESIMLKIKYMRVYFRITRQNRFIKFIVNLIDQSR